MQRKENLMFVIMLALTVICCYALQQLHTSRANERSLSAHVDRLYLAGKGGGK